MKYRREDSWRAPARPAIALCLLLAFLAQACEPYPRDPEETTERVMQSGTLRVGLVHAPPRVEANAPRPSGREVELVAGFATSLGARPEWRSLPIDAAFAALQRGEIDLIAGGLLARSPYRQKAAFTRAYETTAGREGKNRHVLAVRRGENRFLVALENYLRHPPPPKRR